MTRVLIADASKPSLVMSSEVFKDKIPGARVLVAASGRLAIEIAALEHPDICLVDFDLPDVDGATLITELRRVYNGPILLTAFPDDTVNQAVNDLLFGYNDASNWVKKPVRFDDLAQKIELFLIEGKRLGKRFPTALETLLIAKASGRGKRAPKVVGQLLNISLGGACVKLRGQMKMKKSQELTIAIALSNESKELKETAAKVSSRVKGRAAASLKSLALDTKIKAKVAWYDKDGNVGLQFSRLTDIQKKELEGFLREI